MSSFTCEHCKTDIIDSENGYVTGCKHYPIEKLNKELFDAPKTAEDRLKFYSKAPFGEKTRD